jgi:uncharacterized protein YndB with AHSA1/START domain
MIMLLNEGFGRALIFTILLGILAACNSSDPAAPGEPAMVTLTVLIEGEGTVTGVVNGQVLVITDTDAGWTADVEEGSVVNLVAVPGDDLGINWGVACANVTKNVCTVTINEDTAVTVAFRPVAPGEPGTVILTVNISGTGTVRGTADGEALDVTVTATGWTAAVEEGAAVVLTAAPGEGMMTAWGGACVGSVGTTCTLAVNDATTVTVTFSANGGTDGGGDGGGTDGGTDGSTDGGTDGGTDGSTDGGTDGGTDGSTDGRTDGGTDGSIDGGTDGSTDGGTDGGSDSSGEPAFTAITWDTAASAPIVRLEALGITVNGKLYIFGGYVDSTYDPTAQAHAYDPGTNKWQRLADVPRCLTHAGIATDGTDIYYAGGYIGRTVTETGCSGQIFGTEKAWRYNIASDTYTPLPNLPAERAAGELEYLNGRLHYFGGTNRARTADTGNHYVLDLSNLAAGWTEAAPLPNPRNHLGGAVLNGKIYAVGGAHGHDDNSVPQSDVHVYDPDTNTWQTAAPLPRGVSHISSAAFVMEGRIIVMGGEHTHRNYSADVTAYDPVTDMWTPLTPLPNKRYSGVAGELNGLLYFSGGSLGSRATYRGEPQRSGGN